MGRYLWLAFAALLPLLSCRTANYGNTAYIPLPSRTYPLRFGMTRAQVEAAIPEGTAKPVDAKTVLVTAPPLKRGKVYYTTTGYVKAGRLSGVQVTASLTRDGAISRQEFRWHQERFRARCASLYGYAPARSPKDGPAEWVWKTEALEARLDLPPPAGDMTYVAVLGALTLKGVKAPNPRKPKPKPKVTKR